MLMHLGIYPKTLRTPPPKNGHSHKENPVAEQYPFSMNRGNCSVTLSGLVHLNMCVVPVCVLIRADWVMATTQQGRFSKMKCICSAPGLHFRVFQDNKKEMWMERRLSLAPSFLRCRGVPMSRPSMGAATFAFLSSLSEVQEHQHCC